MKDNIISHSKPYIDINDVEAVKQTVELEYLSTNKIVNKFENKISDYIDRSFSRTVNSGSSALQIALRALNVGKNDEVIIPTYTCPSLLNSIYEIQAKPIVCDINKDNLNISYKEVQNKITSKTKTIILPHTFGNIINIRKFYSFNIPIIEDFTQAFGATYEGSMIGSFGDISICSFGSTKMITMGQGGILLTDSEKNIKEIERLLDYDFNPQEVKYSNFARFNYNITDFQAAMGLSQFKKTSYFLKKRKDIARKYNRILRQKGMDVLPIYEKNRSVYYRYLFKVNKEKRSKYLKKFEKNNIQVISSGTHLLHRYIKNYTDNQFPNAVDIFNEVISIPIYPALTKNEINYIYKNLESIIMECKS